jgi:hypothetical protein
VPNYSKYFIAALVSLGMMAGATLIILEDGNAQWRMTPTFSAGRVHFTVRHWNTFGDWSSSRDVSLDNFRGFSLSMLASPGPAKFEYVADAGRLICEGRFLLGAGSGSYTFVTDHAFVAALQQMGYDAPDDEQLFSMLMMDINREFARDVRDAGLHASTRDLVQLKMHGVDLNYIRETRQAGYENFSAGDYAQLRTHGVQPDFVQVANRLGYHFTAADLTQMTTHGVDSGYLKRLKDAGMRNLKASEIAQLRMHGVD